MCEREREREREIGKKENWILCIFACRDRRRERIEREGVRAKARER